MMNLIPRTIPFALFTLGSLILSFPALAQLSLDDLPGVGAGDDNLEEEGELAEPILIPPDFAGNIRKFTESLGLTQAGLADTARQALTSLTQGEDLEALKLFDKLKTSGLTKEQRGYLQDAKIAIDTYLLERNFGEQPQFRGPVADVLSTLKTEEKEDLVPELQGILEAGSPTPEQRALLKELVSQAKSWF